MAADILAYKATHVPVGEDQKQHLELTRDIAGAFNAMVDEDFFPLPEPQILGEATRVMSLRDGTSKMSKSDASDFSRINMNDDADTIVQKIRKAKTDPDVLPKKAEALNDRPEARNLVTIYAALAGTDIDTVLAEYGTGLQFKPALADLAVAKLEQVTQAMRLYMNDTAVVIKVLDDGAERAHAIARPIMSDIRKRLGFLGESMG